MHAIISATAKITTNSGLTFMPRVSSSKNRSRPALCAGMGALLSRFFSLFLLMAVASDCLDREGSLIKVVFLV